MRSLSTVNRVYEKCHRLTIFPLIRAYSRTVAAASQGTLVWADRRTCGGIPVVAFIYKRQQLPAYAYTGMIMIPTGDWLFVIAMASMERGTTGVRDAIVTARLLGTGQLNVTGQDARGRIAGYRAAIVDDEDPFCALRRHLTVGRQFKGGLPQAAAADRAG